MNRLITRSGALGKPASTIATSAVFGDVVARRAAGASSHLRSGGSQGIPRPLCERTRSMTSLVTNVHMSNRNPGKQRRAIHSTRPAGAQDGSRTASTDSASQLKATSPSPVVPADISNEEYHNRADDVMEELLARLEDLQEDREDVEVEYSVRNDPLLYSTSHNHTHTGSSPCAYHLL